MSKRITIILVFIIVLGVVLVLAYRALEQGVYDFYAYLDDPRIYASQRFLEAALVGDEQKAYPFLSQRTQAAVTRYCAKGQVIFCFDKVVEPEWGRFQHAMFEPNYNESADKAHTMFLVVWENEKRLIGVTVIKEASNWRVDSWRGFIPLSSSDKERGSLIDGSSQQNQFPPPDFLP